MPGLAVAGCPFAGNLIRTSSKKKTPNWTRFENSVTLPITSFFATLSSPMSCMVPEGAMK
jgi:hypothetical protein